jgi:hypothetical protein
MSVHAYHGTTAETADAILRDGFRDAEGGYGTTEWRSGVWVTIDEPWDEAIGPVSGDDPALLVIEIPMDLFTRYEWVEDLKGYREALIPADELNRYPVWRAWECIECGTVAPERSPGWHSELLEVRLPRERISTCPECTERANS